MKKETFEKFLTEPNRETYLALRQELIDSPSYNPYSGELSDVEKLFEEEKLQEACDLLNKAMGNLMLSPRAQRSLALLNHKLGKETAVQLCLRMEQSCLAGMIATGDGTPEKPYLVTRVDDEYDILEHLEKVSFTSQSLKQVGDRQIDSFQFEDGSEVCFDITDAKNHLAKKLSQS